MSISDGRLLGVSVHRIPNMTALVIPPGLLISRCMVLPLLIDHFKRKSPHWTSLTSHSSVTRPTRLKPLSRCRPWWLPSQSPSQCRGLSARASLLVSRHARYINLCPFLSEVSISSLQKTAVITPIVAAGTMFAVNNARVFKSRHY